MRGWKPEPHHRASPEAPTKRTRLMSPTWWLDLFGHLPLWSPGGVPHGGRPMDFPILDLMDQLACYQRLLALLRPGGLTCPPCGGGRDPYNIHRRRDNSPVIDYRCKGCRPVFNPLTRTPPQRPP